MSRKEERRFGWIGIVVLGEISPHSCPALRVCSLSSESFRHHLDKGLGLSGVLGAGGGVGEAALSVSGMVTSFRLVPGSGPGPGADLQYDNGPSEPQPPNLSIELREQKDLGTSPLRAAGSRANHPSAARSRQVRSMGRGPDLGPGMSSWKTTDREGHP